MKSPNVIFNEFKLVSILIKKYISRLLNQRKIISMRFNSNSIITNKKGCPFRQPRNFNIYVRKSKITFPRHLLYALHPHFFASVCGIH